MAIEQARRFVEKVKADDAYLGRILSIKNPDERLETIRKEGFEFSRDELLQVQRQLQLPGLKKLEHEPRNCCCIFGSYEWVD
ncbi:MAG: Nif11-like leader peptide family natural product precursor [Prosthecochloris sp.]|jgi:predicted ribosomally synthesized peptide with nif11-like leader|nr:Nif11-like leader peptide family natural product precursor [Prosthecochloris sp.]